MARSRRLRRLRRLLGAIAVGAPAVALDAAAAEPESTPDRPEKADPATLMRAL